MVEQETAQLLGSANPNEWDLQPKPNGMWWATCEKWVAAYDAAEEMLNTQLAIATVRLMKWLQLGNR